MTSTVKSKRNSRFKSLHRRRPPVITQARPQFVVVRLSTPRPAHRRVREVHVRREVRVRTGRIRIPKVGRGAWSRRGDASVRRRRPTERAHMRRAGDTVWTGVVVGWRLERLRRGIASWVRRDGGLRMGRVAEVGERGRCGCGRVAGAGLGKVASDVRRNRPVADVVVVCRPLNVQRRKFTGRGNRCLLCGRRRGVDRDVVGKVAVSSRASVLVLTETGFGLRSRLFNGARVVVLMARQSRATGEGFLAVRVGALVRAFAGMDSAMTGQRRGITEWLLY